MKLEILLAILNNLHEFFTFSAFLSGIALVLMTGFAFAHKIDGDDFKLVAKLNGSRNKLIFIFAAFMPLACIPTTKDLWRVRLDLIKLELSSPENIKAGTERLDKIAKELECRYLDECGK